MVAALAWACHPMEGRRRPADSGNLFAVWPRKPRFAWIISEPLVCAIPILFVWRAVRANEHGLS
jgi:hypothetical protein